ncbi:MAG: hypothetical protein JXA67_11490 [Micromonosporaceae bacterium]|nr:hypothetical protein [Micromonosporaceae bacterium]
MSTHPTYPTGRDAIGRWRALPAGTRRSLLVTEASGEPLADLDLAPIVTGYGHTMVIRNRWFLCLAAIGALALSALLANRSWPVSQAGDVTPALPLLALVACLCAILLRAGRHLRYRTLRFWGLAAIERAQLAAGSEAPTDGSTDGGHEVTEIRFNRVRLVSVTVAGWIVVLLLAGVAAYRLLNAPSLSVGNVVFAVVCGLLVLSLLPDIRRQREYFADPTFVRLASGGWELPGTGLRGAWSEVRDIEVISGRALGPRRLMHPGMRVVVLQVDNAQQHADSAIPLRRREVQADHRQYGSPVAFSVSYFFTIPVLDAITALRRYTMAPVIWQ